MKSGLKIGALLMGLAGSCGAAPEAAAFRHVTPIRLPSMDREEVVTVTLPAAMYADTAPDLRDLRVTDSAGTFRPWALDRVTRSALSQARRNSPMRVLTLTEDPDANRLEVLFELEPDAVSPVGLEVITPLRDYEREVRVEGRAGPDAPWVTLAERALLFDARRFMDVSQREVRLSSNTCRQFRMILSAVTDESESLLREITRQAASATGAVERLTVQRRPFRMEQVRWWHEEEISTPQEAVLSDYPLELISRTEDPEKKQTRILLRVGRAPLTRMEWKSPDVNFSRSVHLRVRARAGEPSREIARGVLEQLRFRQFQRARMALEFPEVRGEELELVVENGDNPPVELTVAVAQGATYRLSFFAKPGESYQIYSGGDAEAPKPRYDTVAIQTALAQNAFYSAEPGPTALNPAHRPTSSKENWLSRKGVLLGALILMVAVLAATLFRSVKKLDAP
ncbi:MAG: hypothetical protein U1E27_09620 [Kiritimatiellia bacterium]|nr:hypothetical protein [Kiritimatiellia bacterium]